MHGDSSLSYAVLAFALAVGGLVLGALLLGAGFSRIQTVARVAAVEATTLLGAALGWVLLPHTSGVWVDAVVAHVGGGFLFLATHAVLGEILEQHKTLVLTCFAIGFGLIAMLGLVLPL
jgi:zinc transporter ZupT